jgi:hypothetical protein
MNGSFAEYAVVEAAFGTLVPHAVSSRDAAPLSCAGIAGGFTIDVDIEDEKLTMGTELGADHVVNAATCDAVESTPRRARSDRSRPRREAERRGARGRSSVMTQPPAATRVRRRLRARCSCGISP